MMKTYNKLVRDRIPEIIAGKGHEFRVREIAGDELLVALKAKLVEEFGEFDRANAIAELADILEVTIALAEYLGADRSKLEAIRQKKAETNGSFKRGIFLIASESG